MHHEQRDWLARVSREIDGWFVAESPTGPLVGRLTDVAAFFGEPESTPPTLFLGRSDLSDRPIWKIGPRGKDIDFVRSLAIHFVPSVRVGDVLLEGRFDIHRSSEYALAGLDHAGLARWIAQLRRSMRSSWKPDRIRMRLESSDGIRSDIRSAPLFSPGALDWYRQGRKLKQFREGTLSFVFELGGE